MMPEVSTPEPDDFEHPATLAVWPLFPDMAPVIAQTSADKSSCYSAGRRPINDPGEVTRYDHRRLYRYALPTGAAVELRSNLFTVAVVETHLTKQSRRGCRRDSRQPPTLPKI